MPSLKDIRGRIGSVRNIAQITRAMEMVAASRMKRAQDAILAARPYSDEMRSVLSRVSAVVGEEVDPLLARRPVRRVALVMITTDRGLAGSINANAIRSALRWTQAKLTSNGEEAIEVEAITIGRKGRDGLRRADIPIAAHFPQLGDRPAYSDVTPIARLIRSPLCARSWKLKDRRCTCRK
jgi:F-type H+-transporting ATPase subunit gamma